MKRIKINVEFLLKSSPHVIYRFLTQPDCLVRWFCDEVDIVGDQYTFIWQGAEESAELVDDIEDERLKFVWKEGEKGEFLEFKFYHSAITNETILEITDYCDADEKSEQIQYWEELIKVMVKESGGQLVHYK